MKKLKKLTLNKVELVNLSKATTLQGGANEVTKPLRMCMLSFKDIDCSIDEPISGTIPRN